MRVLIIFLLIFSVIAIPIVATPMSNTVLSFVVNNIIPASIANAGTPTLSEVGHNYSYGGVNTVDIRSLGGIAIEDIHDDEGDCNLIGGMPAAHMYHKASFAYEEGDHVEGADWCPGTDTRPSYYDVEKGNAVGYTSTDYDGSISLYEDPIDNDRFCLKLEMDDNNGCGDGAPGTDVKLWNEADEDGGWAQDYQLTSAFGFCKFYIPSSSAEPTRSNIWQFMCETAERCSEWSGVAPLGKVVFRPAEYGGSTADKLLWNNEAGTNDYDEITSMTDKYDQWVGVSVYIKESSDCGEADGDVYTWANGVAGYANDSQSMRSCRDADGCSPSDGDPYWFNNSINNYSSANVNGDYVLAKDHMYSSAYLGPTRY